MALVKSLVQRLNEWAGWGLPLEGKKRLSIEAERVFQGFVGKVKLAMQVDVLPAQSWLSWEQRLPVPASI